MYDTIGLIAGSGKFPFMFTKAAKKQGVKVIAIGIKEETSPDIEQVADEVVWISLGELKKLLTILKEKEIKHLALAGQVKQAHVLKKPGVLDPMMKLMLSSLDVKNPLALFDFICKKIEAVGVKIVESTSFLDEFLPKSGALTESVPDEAQKKDIEFGFKTAKELARLDIGLTVVIKSGVVLALEAVEGTDETIKRGGLFGGEGTVVVKVARPDQDMRFDIPVVGLDTIEALMKSGASVLAFESGKTLFIDMEECIKQANAGRISLVGI